VSDDGPVRLAATPGDLIEVPRWPVHPANRSYIIATAPRTGSSLLAEALSATKRAGTPNEFFDIVPANEQYWARRYAVPKNGGYVDRMIEASQTPNGVFGVKLHWHQLPAMRRRLIEAMPATETPDNRPVYDLLQRRFPGMRFIWLSRRNKVAQAISYYRAANSKVWRLWNDGRSPPPAPAGKVEFDRAAIEIFLRRVQSMDVGWRQFFTAHKIPALMVIYEDFVDTYEHTVRGVMKFLGQESGDLILPPPELVRLADDESLDWEHRFRAGRPASTPNRATAVPTGQTPAVAVPVVRPQVPVPKQPAVPTPAAEATQTRPAARKRAAAVPKAPKSTEPPLPLIAYDVGSPLKTTLVPGGPSRAWMDATPRRYAYRCLPMVIANQWGWLIQTQHRVEAVWDGTEQMSGLIVTGPDGRPSPSASSHFGSGVLTFHVGFLFRTPPGYNLHVRGPANWPKDGISALEGVIEADWTESTFTMNWKLTRPNHKVVFEAGEPIAMISPVKRGELERFVAETRLLTQDSELHTKYTEWSASRSKFNADLRTNDSDARKQGWQKDYVRGYSISGEPAPEHQTGVELTEFKDRR
jgi:LPS sulfotransferase NodH